MDTNTRIDIIKKLVRYLGKEEVVNQKKLVDYLIEQLEKIK